MTYALVPLTAALLSWLLTPPLARLARRLGAMDAPGARKVHEVATPRLGGVSVALAGGLSLALLPVVARLAPASGIDVRLAVPIVAGGAFALGIGVVDDWRGASPLAKLAAETAGALVVIAAGIAIERVTFFGVTYELGWLGVPVTVLWIVGVTNAFNLIDGLDGLAAGIAIIAAGTCAAVLVMRGDRTSALLLGALVGALLGFLPYNFNPARVFLGDGGSLLIGYVLSVTAITGWQKGATVLATGVPMLIFALPLADIAAATARRALARAPSGGPSGRALVERLFAGDRLHIHHRLMALGLSHRGTVLVLYALALAFSALALLSVRP